MEHLRPLSRSIALQTGLLTGSLLGILGALILFLEPLLSRLSLMVVISLAAIVTVIIISWFSSKLAKEPLAAIGESILHIAPETTAAAPDIEKLSIGKEYIKYLVYNLHQVASLQDNKIMAEHRKDATQASNILNHLPLPVFVFNKDQIVTFASEPGMSYSGATNSNDLLGKSLYEAVDLEFQSGFTLESWIEDSVANKATDTAYWRRVKLRIKNQDNKIRLCDMAGYYNKDNPAGVEFIITMFDQSETYSKDEANINLIAIAVHELRTPLTAMRGYVEALQEDLAGTLSGDTAVFMSRTASSLKQLSSFVNNILNMAKINENQLSVKLSEEKWGSVVQQAIDDMGIRAQSLKIQINSNVPAELPTVGADRVTIYEVLTNIIDNALKYSGKSTSIEVSAKVNSGGLVETTVKDYGVGIPAAVLPTLFEKFQRNHRNRDSVSGTGLGLYISRAIVTAHGGTISVKSKEGEGSELSFTLKPYATLAAEEKNGDNTNMVRTAHGWIKNHSLYRR
jgi:signal transduction histidine kinase